VHVYIGISTLILGEKYLKLYFTISYRCGEHSHLLAPRLQHSHVKLIFKLQVIESKIHNRMRLWIYMVESRGDEPYPENYITYTV
jgi:hypothetical protein